MEPTLTAESRQERTCSLTRPVCVDGKEPRLRAVALRFLTAAYEKAILGNHGPAWELDGWGEPMLWTLASSPLVMEVEPKKGLGFDRGRVRCRGGSVTESTAIACATGASLARSAPLTAPSLLHGAAAHSAHVLAGSPEATEAAQQADTQPERGVLADATLPTAALLFEQLAREAKPGGALTAVWLSLLLAGTRSPLAPGKAGPEPDLFDVLRSTLGSKDPHLAQFLAALSLSRFTRESAISAGLPRPELAWEIDGATLPRNLVLPRPLLPTGSAYVLVRLDQKSRDTGLGLRTFCESGTRYAWTLARLGPDGDVSSRVAVLGRESETHAQAPLYELGSTHSVLIVGTNLGGGPGSALDPDETPHPAHSCEVAIDRLPDTRVGR